MSEPTSSACCCCCRHDRADRRVGGDDHRRRRRRRCHGGVLQSARRRSAPLSGLRWRGCLPRHRDPQGDRCAGGRVIRCGCGCGCRATAARAAGCRREVFAHNTSRLARPGWSTTRRCARYILRRLMIDRVTVAAVARELGLSWDTVNTIAMDATQMIVAADTTRLDGVRVIGVDEHRWSHTRHTRRVRHGDHRPDPGAGGHRPGPAARPGPRTLRRSAEDAGWPTSHRSSATRSRSWPWTGSAATRPPRPR